MLIRCLDVESTGLEPPTAAVCELAFCDLRSTEAGWQVVGGEGWFCDPGHPIAPEVSAVHHIIDDDVAGQPSIEERCAEMLAKVPEGEEIVALAAHNNRFDRKLLTDELVGERHWIDTYRCALWLWPEAPAHNCHALRYWLRPEGLRREIATSHRAYGDAYTTAFLVREMLTKTTGKQLIAWSRGPALLPRFTFGKHAMKPIAEVDSGYLKWVLDNLVQEEDVLFTAAHELDRRQQGAAA